MDVHALAQTPIGIVSLVMCGVVAAYAFTSFLRATLGHLSTAAASSGIDQSELLTIDLTGKFRGQLTALLSRVDRISGLAAELADPIYDNSWQKLLSSCEVLKQAEQRLISLLQERDFVDALLLAEFLSGTRAAIPPLKQPFDEEQLPHVIQWHSKTTELLQRMITKIEDAARHRQSSDAAPLSQEFFASLAKLRRGIIKDEERYR
jgi:hypothetical protein